MLISDALFVIEEMNWVASQLREAIRDVPDVLSLDIRVYITRANDLVPALMIDASSSRNSDVVIEKAEENAEPVKSTIDEKDVKVSPTEDEGFKICLGRPDLATLVKEEVECARGPVSVNGGFLFPLN